MFNNFTRFLVMLLLVLVIYVAGKDTKYNNKVDIGWDPVITDVNGSPISVDYYEITVVRKVTGEVFGPYVTSSTVITLQKPKSGTYEIRVKAVIKDPATGNYIYSVSSSSDNEACSKHKDGSQGAWELQFKPSAPLGPIIIN